MSSDERFYDLNIFLFLSLFFVSSDLFIRTGRLTRLQEHSET